MAVEVGVFEGPRRIALPVEHVTFALWKQPARWATAFVESPELNVRVCVHKAVLYNYVVIPKCEILAAVHEHTGTHTHTHTVPLAGYDVIAEDEILPPLTLEMIWTVERNIHQWASSIDRRWANQCLHD